MSPLDHEVGARAWLKLHQSLGVIAAEIARTPMNMRGERLASVVEQQAARIAIERAGAGGMIIEAVHHPDLAGPGACSFGDHPKLLGLAGSARSRRRRARPRGGTEATKGQTANHQSVRDQGFSGRMHAGSPLSYPSHGARGRERGQIPLLKGYLRASQTPLRAPLTFP